MDDKDQIQLDTNILLSVYQERVSELEREVLVLRSLLTQVQQDKSDT